MGFLTISQLLSKVRILCIRFLWMLPYMMVKQLPFPHSQEVPLSFAVSACMAPLSHTGIRLIAFVSQVSIFLTFLDRGDRGGRRGSTRQDLACRVVPFASQASFCGAFFFRYLEELANNVTEGPGLVGFPVPTPLTLNLPLIPPWRNMDMVKKSVPQSRGWI